jgi:hypothetical protein
MALVHPQRLNYGPQFRAFKTVSHRSPLAYDNSPGDFRRYKGRLNKVQSLEKFVVGGHIKVAMELIIFTMARETFFGISLRSRHDKIV